MRVQNQPSETDQDMGKSALEYNVTDMVNQSDAICLCPSTRDGVSLSLLR